MRLALLRRLCTNFGRLAGRLAFAKAWPTFKWGAQVSLAAAFGRQKKLRPPSL
jgi:hypothetical protein